MKSVQFKVEIWSDITCIHCYIANRKFEQALSQFEFADDVAVVWKSFELAPGLKPASGKTMYEFLAAFNRATVEQVKHVCKQFENSATEVGLTIHFDRAVPANTFLAHRFLHFAKTHQLENIAKDVLFQAHFGDGKDINDLAVLAQLGTDIGLSAATVTEVLQGSNYVEEVNKDIHEARQLGIRGVPYYRFGSNHTISGAKDSSAFLDVLKKAYSEWRNEVQPSPMCSEGGVCAI
jgi:predicted DsbA family dithiol-disulfide isomerase